jgi:WD40 repeat protein
VQPDRPCYIRRAADEELLDAISSEQFAFVLGPRATGKSSLMGRAIRRLRADGEIAAVVDLSQIGTRGESQDSARWHYSIAYRVCRELRLKVDLQAWWQERALLSNEHRLVEFFWDIVLANTDVSVTIFFDEAERLIDRPFAAELFAALHSAYLRRVSEPEYSRLNFVVLGVATPEQLCPDPDSSPFTSGRAIQLDDLTVEECFGLASGFEGPEVIVHGLIERIHGWTHGQPYLTQKLARGVVRKGGGLAALDPALHELFLAPAVSGTEPYLAQMRAMLTDGSAAGRQAGSMLLRLAKGGEVILDPGSPAQQVLHLGGFVSSDENGMLRFRNRVIEEAFDPTWLGSRGPLHVERPVTAGAIAALCVALFAYWYVQVLPRPYIETLQFVTSDYALAEQAHDRLSGLPGFGRRADALLADVMIRRSNRAETVAEARAADAVLRGLAGRDEIADRLMADFWLRRSEAAAHLGDRDAALVNALAAVEAGSPEAAHRAANLINGDYALLDQTVHFDSTLVAMQVDWERGQIVGVDSTNRLHRIPQSAANADPARGVAGSRRPSSVQLTALQHVGVTRGFFVDEPGRAGTLQLRLTVDHARPGDLLVRLRAPSGAAAELLLPQRSGGLEQFIITGSTSNGLSRLADESITGQWELTVYDRLGGESGRLISWGLSFSGVPQFWDDNPVEGIPLPDPERTEQISVTLADDGRKAVTVPVRPDARGAASVWDLRAGAVVADLPLTNRASSLQFLADDRLLVVGPASAALWRIGEVVPAAEWVVATGFTAPPVVSPDKRFFATAESSGDRMRVSVFTHAEARLLGSFETDAFQSWALAEAASFVAVTDGTRRGRVLDPATGNMRAEFFHDLELARVLVANDQVVAVDVQGEVLAWSLESERRTLTPADAVHVGMAADATGLSLSADGTLASFAALDGSFSVSRLRDGYRLAVFDHGPGASIESRIDPGSGQVVSADAAKIRSWRLPSGAASGHDFGELSAVAIDESGEFAVVGFRSGRVRLIRNLPEAIERGPDSTVDYFGHRRVITSLAINGSGSLAASGGSDGLVRVWDTQTGVPAPYHLRHPAGPINALAFSPDDRWIVTAGPRSVRVFELGTGSLVNELEVDGAARAVAFAPDGELFAVGDSSGNIFLLGPGGTQGVQAIRGRSPINVLRFADSPELLASGSSDGNFVLWNTLEGRAVSGARRFSAPVHWIGFSSGESRIRVQSGSWLYDLDQDAADLAVTAATLLPTGVRSGPALAESASEPPMIRALASVGGGQLALAEIWPVAAAPEFSAGQSELSSGPAVAPEISGDGRDWRWILGLEIENESGRVQIVSP